MNSQQQITGQILAFNKTIVNQNIEAVRSMNDYTERFLSNFLEKSAVVPEEGKKAIFELMKAYKNGCEDFNNLINNNLKKAEELFI
jgi:hypothetical protein